MAKGHHVGRQHRKHRKAACRDALALLAADARKHIKPYLIGAPVAVRWVQSSCTPPHERQQRRREERAPSKPMDHRAAPAYREKMSAALRAAWARRKAMQRDSLQTSTLGAIPPARELVKRGRRGR